MNWLLIFVILFIAGNIIWGYYRGFLRVAYSLAEWVIVLIVVIWVTPHVNQFLSEHTSLPATLEAYSKEELRQSVLSERTSQGTTEIQPETDNHFLEIFGIKLPDIITENLLDSDELADRFLEATGVYDMIAGKIARLAMQGIAFFIVLIVTFLVFHGIGLALKLVDKIPIVNGANRTAGMFAGLVKGFLFVWIAFAIIATGVGTAWGRWLISFIYEAPILTWLYENNPVLDILVNFL